MKRPVLWSDAARADYLAIIRYVAQDNPDAALRIADRLNEIAGGLGDMATGRPGRVFGTYEKVAPGLPYILAYEIALGADRSEVVAILHVIHGARDWPADAWPAGLK